MRISFFLILFILIVCGRSLAQNEGDQPDDNPAGRLENKSNSIFGKLIDNTTGKPVESGSVFLYRIVVDSTKSLIAGTVSRANGDFKFSNLPSLDSFRIAFSALGYEAIERKIILPRPGINSGGFEKDLGNIQVSPSVKQLSNVTVTASAPALTLGIDRKIFNVEKSITAAGGTAVDVMKNIPSVSVDVDGNVELRNSTPQIFVDGRPTILTLDQIPADHIEKVELITNPSAKFDAASSGGIINIVLKKNKRVGLNGLFTIGGGTPQLFNSNLNINLRQGKFNFFVTGGHNRSGGKANGATLRENRDNGQVTDFFNQLSTTRRSRKFTSVRFGADYFIDNRNTLTASQNFVVGRFANTEFQDQEYLDGSKTLIYIGERNSSGQAGFNRKNTRINFKHDFPEDGKELTADINYNYGNRSDNSNILNEYFNPDRTIYQPSATVRNAGRNNNRQLTIQVDYVNPITTRSKIEMGLRNFHDQSSNLYEAFSVNNGIETKLPLSNNYEYSEMVAAGYVTFSNKNKKENFSYQVGLRAEYSKFTGNMIDSARKFGYEYPDELPNLWKGIFPSFFLTRKIDDNNELQLNYTRRIRRPRFWELNPFIDLSDPVNLSQGNPQLKPEFINSFELNYNLNFKGGSLLSAIYFRNNPNDITDYSDTISAAQYQQLNNAGVDPNAVLSTYINASTTNRYGAEFTLQQKFGANFDITPSIDLQYRTVKATVNNIDLNNDGFNWEAKLIVNYKIETKAPSLFNNLSFQLNGEYESPEVFPQGKTIAEYAVDCAVKKEFLKDKKANLTFSVNDVFNTRKWGDIYDTDQFYQEFFRRWNVRNFRISFTYKFGDANFTFGKRGGSERAADD